MLLLTDPLKDPTETGNKHFISFILGIVKHILSVPGICVTFFSLTPPDPLPTTSSATSHRSQLQDLIIESLHKHVFFDVLLVLMHTINKQNQDWALLILDIVYFIFKRDEPADILAGEIKLGATPTKKKVLGRHPNFGGTFVTTNADGNRAIANASYSKIQTISSLPPLEPAPIRYGRNRPPPPGRKSPAHMRPILELFANKILSAGFNGMPEVD